jgi:DNA-binding response OmpR family regulator
MKVLVLDPSGSELARVARILRDGGHEVVLVTDDGAARAAYAGERPQVALVGAVVVDDRLKHRFTMLRELNKQGYLIAAFNHATEEQLTKVYSVGADAYLDRCATEPRVLAHMQAIERLLVGFGVKMSARRPADAEAIRQSPIRACAEAKTWGESATAVQGAVSQMMSLPVDVIDATAQVPALAMVSTIALVSAPQKAELRVVIGTDDASARSLATHMFGDASAELAADMLGEIANLVMGTLKAGLNTEGLGFTAGLPSPVPANESSKLMATALHQNAFVLTIGQAKLTVRLGLSQKGNALVQTQKLGEGMVLAKDLFNARGLLLLAGGTRLSQTMIDKLTGTLQPTATVEVVI